MQRNTFKTNNLSLDQRVLFLEAFGIDLDTYVKFLGRDARDLCKTDEEYSIKLSKFYEFLERRKQGFSVATIIGKKNFFEHTFFVDENVLIPRPETEELVENGILYINELISCKKYVLNGDTCFETDIKVADVCTGSFCIGLSIYLHFLDRGIRLKLFASDISTDALKVAEKNLEHFRKIYMKTNNFDIRQDVFLFKSNLFDEYNEYSINMKDKFDLIISNPPYISEGEKENLSREVQNEPSIALYGGDDGLSVIQNLVKEAPNFLKCGGVLLIEHGIEQGDAIKMIFEKNVFTDVKTIDDLTARPRFTSGVLKDE